VKQWKDKYLLARPSDKQLDSLLRNHGSVQEVKKVLADMTRLKGVISSTASIVEEAPALRKQVQDLQDQLSAANLNSVEASEAAKILEEAQAAITTRSQALVSDALCSLEAAQQQNVHAENKLEEIQLKYWEVRRVPSCSCCLW
jgi:chromosome segregation ATPase